MKLQNSRKSVLPALLLPALLAFSAFGQSPSERVSVAPSTPEPDSALEDARPERPWYAFWRKADDQFLADLPSGRQAAAAAVPEEPCWILSLADGTQHLVRLSSLSFKLDVAPSAIPFSPDTFSALVVRPPSDDPADSAAGTLFAILRAPDSYALSAPLPRNLSARAADGSRLSVPWAEVVALRDPAYRGRGASARPSIPAVVTFDDGFESYSVSTPFPVSFVPVEADRVAFTVPSWLLASITVNPDRSCTLRSVFGDVLTGVIPPLKRFPGFANATSIVFKQTDVPEAPAGANRYRLASGDVLVASPVSAPDAPAARASLRSVAGSGAPAAPYLLAPALAPDTPLSIPADAIEAVAALSSPLPPAASRPYSFSARATDEILVPAASFHLGCAAPNAPADESPSVNVPVDPFYIASTPVTVAQFAAFIEDTGHRPKPEARSWNAPGFVQTPNDPVVAVSWRDAAAYCNWLSKKARLPAAYSIPSDERLPVILDLAADGYRLPLEAEWEYAARNLGKPVSFPWGDDADEAAAAARANFTPTPATDVVRPYLHTSPVKAFPPNDLGLYDLAGNVFEWCQDVYSPDAYSTYYAAGDISPIVNPPALERRVMRGGSFLSPLRALRTTSRAFGLETAGTPAVGAPRVGFRVVRNAP